jgi:hypothetical protein
MAPVEVAAHMAAAMVQPSHQQRRTEALPTSKGHALTEPAVEGPDPVTHGAGPAGSGG